MAEDRGSLRSPRPCPPFVCREIPGFLSASRTCDFCSNYTSASQPCQWKSRDHLVWKPCQKRKSARLPPPRPRLSADAAGRNRSRSVSDPTGLREDARRNAVTHRTASSASPGDSTMASGRWGGGGGRARRGRCGSRISRLRPDGSDRSQDPGAERHRGAHQNRRREMKPLGIRIHPKPPQDRETIL